MMASLSGNARDDGAGRAVRDRREVRASRPAGDRPRRRRRDADERPRRADHGRQVLAALERPAAGRARAEQPRPEPGDLGAARDGGRPALRGQPVDPRLPVRAVRGDDRPARRPRRRARPRRRGVGRGARRPTGPAVLEAIVDPEVPPLPPHITFEQAKHFAQAVLHGDREPQVDDRATRCGRCSTRSRPGGDRDREPAAAGPPVEAVSAAAYTIPTDRPESDGTFEWDSTTIVVVEVAGPATRPASAGRTRPRRRGAGRRPARPGGRRARARSTSGVAHRAMRAALRNTGEPGAGAMALSAVDVALWDLKAKLLERPAGVAARPRARGGARLRQRRLLLVLARAAARAARRLGRRRDPAREDEGRPRAGRRPRAGPGRAGGDRRRRGAVRRRERRARRGSRRCGSPSSTPSSA